ncbi:MAG: SpoIID/LytB domain-containing protein [Candidatus Coprovivens sp.]
MFSKFRNIYALANRLGLDMLPPSASDEEQMQNIAEQLGIDYDGTEDCEKAMLDSLYDMEAGEEDPYDNGYEDDSYAEYEEGQEGQERKDNKKQEKKKEEQTEETTEGGDKKNPNGGDNPEGGEKGDGGQGGDTKPGEEKGPNDNGYDPNRQQPEGGDGTGGSGVDKPAGQDGEHGSALAGDPNTQPGGNNGTGGTGSNGTGTDGSNSTALTKPGETNPNQDINRNGSSPNAGNGYNSQAAQKAKNASETSTTVGNRNYEHQQRVQRGKQAEKAAEAAKKNPTTPGKGNDAKKSTGLPKKNVAQKQAQQARRKAQQIKNRQRMKKLKENLVKMWGFLIKHPYLIFAIILVLLFIIIILAVITDEDVTGGGGGNGAMNCTYSLSGVTSTGDVELSGVKVELINCDGTSSDYEVLANVDFEKYVLGVALAEIGPSAPDEALKAQIVAARNFALTRNSGMCPSNPDNCFYGYNASTGKIRMRACEADQVYWDYNNDIYRQDRGAISIYSPEINSGTLWKSALDETRKAEVEALADEVKGKVLMDESGNVYKTHYTSVETDQFTAGANAGKTYDEILNEVYSGSSDISSAKCAKAGNIDYGDYTLSSDGHTILHQPLDQFLEDNGTSLEEFNKLIADNVDDAGFGTRAGVVAAAVTLIGELGDNYGVKVPYYWGGGHYDGVIIGAHHYWGSDPDCTTYANNQTYDYCGLDCSGFVPWAIKNGGFGMNQMLAGDFKNIKGAEKVTLKSNQAVLQPGDLLESEGHIVLVVGIDEDTNEYICAEAAGNQYGVLFMRRPFNPSGYWGVNMDGYYNNSANIRSQ